MDGPVSAGNRQALQAITRAIGDSGTVRLTASQNRHMDEERPDWTLRIEGAVFGMTYVVENDGPSLGQILDDAGHTLARLGIDVVAAMKDEAPR